MAQKTSFGVRMCLLSIQSDKIVCKGSKTPNSGSVGKSQPKRKRSKIPYELSCFAKYTNGCNNPLNLTEIETKNVFINICIRSRDEGKIRGL